MNNIIIKSIHTLVKLNEITYLFNIINIEISKLVELVEILVYLLKGLLNKFKKLGLSFHSINDLNIYLKYI